MEKKIHWGGPVKLIDTSRQTPYIVLDEKEKLSIIKELNNKITDKDILIIFSYLKDREIVDIQFR